MAGQQPEGAGQGPAAQEPERGAAEIIEDDPQTFVLGRELAEVHLLLDNLSADPDTTIQTLASRQPADKLPDGWLEQICRISWPPPDSPPQKAEQAALLIRAKDYLNRLAKPASGMSIAFTLMVTQGERRTQPPLGQRRPGVDLEETLWRSSLAERAYPDLKGSSATFRVAMKSMRWLLLVWLLLTCLLSWNVAFGNSTLAEYAAAKTRLAEAQAVVNNAEAGRRPPTASAGQAARTADQPRLPEPTPTAAQAAPAQREVGYCNRWRLLEPTRARNGQLLLTFESAEQRQACLTLEESKRQMARAEKGVVGWLSFWGWLVGESNDPASIATRLASVLGTAVLPVFYGLLGAAAAVLRSISHKIRTSTLTPRDLSLSVQQLALGAVVGACIGLFIVSEESTLIGPVALSGSAISFVAGFGVEAVFQALEALISRIFNIAPVATRAGKAEGPHVA